MHNQLQVSTGLTLMDSEKQYTINEIFYSLQGEGIRAGTANVFVRFSGCNLRCSIDDEHSGFDCDTEFVSGYKMTAQDIFMEATRIAPLCNSIILTGGEPALQIDDDLIQTLKTIQYYLAIETNGTRPLPDGIDWVCVSPKSAEHTLRVQRADELKYVRHYGQSIPRPTILASHLLISPSFQPDGSLRKEDLLWCIKLVLENPDWRLSVQQHKFWNVR